MPHFHFSIGPVQEFVNQARRTSDFWAGSFLLSWLAGVAMCAVKRQGGSITFPFPPDNYLNWIEGINEPAANNAMSRIGAIPNRFSAEVGPDFDGKCVTGSVREAWIALANHTLKEDKITLPPASQAVWDRQITQLRGGLWDMQWVIVPNANDHHTLDARKHWRSHYPDKEPGRKCSLMHGWQELSGAPYDEADAFWDALRLRPHGGPKLDIDEKERLCAPAYVKRRFMRHFGSFTLKTTQSLRGWDLPPNVPSTQYLAAAPWLAAVLSNEKDAGEIAAFEAAARACGIRHGEQETRLQRVEQATLAYTRNNQRVPVLQNFDAAAFFEDEIRSSRDLDADDRQRGKLICALKRLQERHGAASKYYALLLMDGDSLGKHIDTAPLALATALKDFIDQVPGIVQARSGFLVYAGGDDVLALLPMDEALGCALALRQCYLRCFKLHTTIDQPSISAAIEFAHYKTPLTQIINDAHVLLDAVAKDGHGRDSLAVRVWKGSGVHLTWGQPWNIALAGSKEHADHTAGPLIIDTIVARFQQNPALFSSGFFTRASDVYDAARGLGDAAAIKELILYEYGHSLTVEHRALPQKTLEALLEPLYTQSIPHRRLIADNGSISYPPDPAPLADAALLVRFLWQKGLDRSTLFANNDANKNADENADKNTNANHAGDPHALA
jgi:CRISPR-associated protein Cmr2